MVPDPNQIAEPSDCGCIDPTYHPSEAEREQARQNLAALAREAESRQNLQALMDGVAKGKDDDPGFQYPPPQVFNIDGAGNRQWVGQGETHMTVTSGGVGATITVTESSPQALASVGRRLELKRWWLDLAEVEVEKLLPKVDEYGATDLIDIGHDLARIAGRVITDEEAAELGCYFYIRGKLSRWTDAVARGDRPSDDTLHDLGVYVRMVQRIREAGAWPGLKGTIR